MFAARGRVLAALSACLSCAASDAPDLPDLSVAAAAAEAPSAIGDGYPWAGADGVTAASPAEDLAAAAAEAAAATEGTEVLEYVTPSRLQSEAAAAAALGQQGEDGGNAASAGSSGANGARRAPHVQALIGAARGDQQRRRRPGSAARDEELSRGAAVALLALGGWCPVSLGEAAAEPEAAGGGGAAALVLQPADPRLGAVRCVACMRGVDGEAGGCPWGDPQWRQSRRPAEWGAWVRRLPDGRPLRRCRETLSCSQRRPSQPGRGTALRDGWLR